MCGTPKPSLCVRLLRYISRTRNGRCQYPHVSWWQCPALGIWVPVFVAVVVVEVSVSIERVPDLAQIQVHRLVIVSPVHGPHGHSLAGLQTAGR